MKKRTVILFTIVSSLMFWSCGNSDSKTSEKNKQLSTKDNSVEQIATGKTQRLSGDYICTEHWNSDLIGKAIMSFDKDSVNFAGIAKTTYRIKDDSVFIDMHQYEMGFAIDGNTLKATGGAGTVAYTKK